MFDIGFSELVVIGIVALVVLGPERLPSVARTVGHLLGRMQRYVNEVKRDLNREMELDELKKLQSQVITSARELETSMRQEIDSARGAFDARDTFLDPPTDAAPEVRVTPVLAETPSPEDSGKKTADRTTPTA
jgi:sec-independent protein translocase protein TatB